jgi:hypothetical protein
MSSICVPPIVLLTNIANALLYECFLWKKQRKGAMLYLTLDSKCGKSLRNISAFSFISASRRSRVESTKMICVVILMSQQTLQNIHSTSRLFGICSSVTNGPNLAVRPASYLVIFNHELEKSNN